MRSHGLSSRGGVLATFLVVVVAASCVNSGANVPQVPDAADAADGFVEAWNEGEATAMSDLLVSGSSLTRTELDRILSRAPGKGVVQGYEVSLTEEVETPSDEVVAESDDEVTVEAPYEISYDVEGFNDTTLEGQFELAYDKESSEWVVDVGRDLMFPGVVGAKRLDLKADWPARGEIVDRKGRVLAKGDGPARNYPFGTLAGSTIGHIEPLTRRALRDAASGHEIGDLVGGAGLEEAYEERLAGKPDLLLRVLDKKGKSVLVMGEQQGAPSRDLRTTLDIEVQRATSNAFGSTVGGAVVLDPKSGDLLAAVSSSEIDPNGYVGAAGVEPFNRALSGNYPPGSSMKVVTAGAALDTGVVKPSTQLTGPAEYQGVRNFESGAYASLDFASAVRFSVNTAFAQVALDLGAKRLSRYAELFGFNRPPAMPLEAAESSFPFPEDPGDLMWGSIGQAQDLATPLQMASIAATVANDGLRMEPRSSFTDNKKGRRVLKKATARELAVLMEGAVNGGTGTSARISGVRIAGKTGTAEVDVGGKRKNHAWFVSFAPIDSPQVAIAVVSEYGGIGGQVAAPIARNIYIGVLPLT
ncbi:MAG: penicillin-binding transpeptidase domain-containing protein [Actinomycetota bacterium]|nr:penicillin-binding transpeptidase domain-containing protein [Actinomycetota bacterium]